MSLEAGAGQYSTEARGFAEEGAKLFPSGEKGLPKTSPGESYLLYIFPNHGFYLGVRKRTIIQFYFVYEAAEELTIPTAKTPNLEWARRDAPRVTPSSLSH